MRGRRRPASPAALASLLACLLAAAGAGPAAPAPPAAAPASPAVTTPPPPAPRPAPALAPRPLAPGGEGPEVVEPFFALVLRIIADDSLGTWTQRDLRRLLLAGGRRTRLPLRRIRSLSRWAVLPAAAAHRDGAVAARRWRLELTREVALPMPYDILGYHPGTLLLSRVVEATEWDLGGPNLHVPEGDGPAVVPLADLRVLCLDAGWVAMDVDAVVDRLLGSRLDDSWLTGFALVRAGGSLRGLGLARSRDGRKLLGEMDFPADAIRPQGDAVARAISRWVRPWCEPGERERWWLSDSGSGSAP